MGEHSVPQSNNWTNNPSLAPCIVTGGLGGLGLLACHELALKGYPNIVTVSRSRTLGPGAMIDILDSIQENAVHFSVQADISDSTTVPDLLKRLSGSGAVGFPKSESPPVDTYKVLCQTSAVVKQVMLDDTEDIIDDARWRRIRAFHVAIEKRIREVRDKTRHQPYGGDYNLELLQYEEKLEELASLLAKFSRKTGRSISEYLPFHYLVIFMVVTAGLESSSTKNV